jgi:chemotaxis signal transduction protein
MIKKLKNNVNKFQNFLFTTFCLEEKFNETQVRCLGSRDIIALKYDAPSEIRGLVEFDSTCIPVVDLNFQFYSEPTLLGNSSCILIVKHRYNGEYLYTGILIEDVNQVLDLVEALETKSLKSELNRIIKFVTKIDTQKSIENILNESHVAVDEYESLYRQDQNFIHFKKLNSQDFIKN